MKPPRAVLGIVLAATVAACSPHGESQHILDAAQAPSPAGAHGSGMHHGHDAGMMQRHAEEAGKMVAEMRGHLEQMRQLTPPQQHERMAEHATRVAAMLSMMDRHMREMGSNHGQMAQMMGMHAEQHRRATEAMQVLRTELEQLQSAPVSELAARMPAHLDRLAEMLPMMEQCASHRHHS
jgi:hypothetical protein